MIKNDIEIFRSVLREFERAIDIANQHMNCCDVSITQCHALLEVSTNEGINLNELALKLNLDKSSVSRTIENLVKKQLVKRITPEKNRRSITLWISKSGKKLIEKINTNNNHYFSEIFGEVSALEFEQFMNVFNRITKKMNLLTKHNYE